MTKDEIQQIIKSITKNKYYKRVSDSHPLELYLGLNNNGNQTLRFNGDFNPINIQGTKYIEIKQVKTSNGNSLMFSYISDNDVDVFYNLCEDLINSTIDCSTDKGYKTLVNRFKLWKKLFTNSPKDLSESAIQGLIGELSFLDNFIIKTYGEDKGISCWTGPEYKLKDFSINKTWYEVKTIDAKSKTIKISSVEQLESTLDGWLIVYRLEKMSPSYDGISLNKLVNKIYNQLTYEKSKDEFISKLKKVGYSLNHDFNNFVYQIISYDTYLVNNKFPRLVKSNIPTCIGSVEYEILLNMINEYKGNMENGNI